MKPVLYILIATLLTGSVSYVLGAAVLRALRVTLYRAEERWFAFVGGSACLSAIVFVLTAAGLASKPVFYIVGFAILAAGWWRGLFRARGEELPPIPRYWNIAFRAAFGVFGLLYLANALAPETSADAVSYHVALVAQYAREHHFPRITDNIYASLSEGIEMLFLYAFSIGKHSAPAMCEFLFLLALPLGMLLYARRIGRPIAGVAGGLLLYASPVFGRVGTIGHNDVAGAVVVFAVFYVLQIWRQKQESGLVVLAGLLAGFAYAVKYTLGVAVVYATVTIVVVCWRRKQPWIKPASLAGLAACAVMAPWMIKNIIVVANPVSPFFNRVFPNPYVSVSFEDGYINFLRHFNGVTIPELPLELTVRGDRLQGLIGPIFLLAPMALIAARYPAGRQLLIAFAVFLLPYFGNLGTRFLMPALAFVALAMALAVDRFPVLAAVLIATHLILSWPPVVSRYAAQYAWRLEGAPWNAALRRTSEEQYLREHIPDYDLGLALNRLVPPTDRVLTPAMGNLTYQTRHLVIPYESVFGGDQYDVLFRATTEDMQPALRRSASFPAVIARRLRVVLTARAPAQWVVGELRVFANGQEIPRNPRWRLRADPNPWGVQRAFDNSPVTVWTSDRDGAPGMFVQIDFGGAQQVDRVSLDLPRNNYWVTLRVEADGRTVATETTAEEIPWPSRMRRAAVEELKANGIGWLVFKDGDLLAEDLLTRSVQWGIEQKAYSNGYRLWQLQ